MLSRSTLAQQFPVFNRFHSLSLPLHGSHRGGRHWGKENTLETYRRAVYQAQTDILEIDLWKTIDDHLVLNHDGIINDLSVKQSTLKQLQDLDRELITVDQCLNEFLSRSSLVFFFDMKDIDAIPLTMTLIEQFHLHDRIIFGAVDRHINEHLQHVKPASIPLCADIQTMKTIVQDYLQGKLTQDYTYHHDILGLFLEQHTRNLMTADFLHRIHQSGKPLALVGSLLDQVDIQKEMIQLGVDILFTDRPDVLRETFNSYSNQSN